MWASLPAHHCANTGKLWHCERQFLSFHFQHLCRLVNVPLSVSHLCVHVTHTKLDAYVEPMNQNSNEEKDPMSTSDVGMRRLNGQCRQRCGKLLLVYYYYKSIIIGTMIVATPRGKSHLYTAVGLNCENFIRWNDIGILCRTTNAPLCEAGPLLLFGRRRSMTPSPQQTE